MFKIMFKIVVTILFPWIALIDWTISNYPLSEFMGRNIDLYNEFMTL